jgi:hypothetical protein
MEKAQVKGSRAERLVRIWANTNPRINNCLDLVVQERALANSVTESGAVSGRTKIISAHCAEREADKSLLEIPSATSAAWSQANPSKALGIRIHGLTPPKADGNHF